MHRLTFVYITLSVYPLIGYIMRYILPRYVVHYASQFIILIATPLLVITSISFKGIVSELWTVPIIALMPIVIGAVFSLIVIDLNKSNERILLLLSGTIKKLNVSSSNSTNKPEPQYIQWINNLNSTFLVGGMIGNTGYIAFPIILLSLASDQVQYFIWAVLFDICSNSLMLFSIAVAAYFIHGKPLTSQICLKSIKNIFLNPIFGSLVIGLVLSNFNFPDELKNFPNQTRNIIIPLCLMALGMQINLPKTGIKSNRLSSYNIQSLENASQTNYAKDTLYPIFNKYYLNTRSISQSSVCLILKMFVVPVVMAAFLLSFRVDNLPVFVILLQVAMPPLLISNNISEEYNLYRDFNMAISSIGYMVLVIITVPILLTLFNLDIG